MGRRVAKWLAWVGLGVALLVGGADTALRFTRLDKWVASRLISLAPAAVRDITIDGPIEFRLLPRPHVSVAGLSVRNNRGEALVSARSASLDIVLGALVRGVLEFSPVTLRAPSVEITIDENGRSNWDMPSTGARHSAPPKGDLFVEDAHISFRDDRWKGLAFEATAPRVEIGVSEGYARYVLKGTVSVRSVSAEFDLVLERARGNSYAADLAVTLPGAGLGIHLTGNLSELSPIARLNGQFEAQVESVQSFISNVYGPIKAEALSSALRGGFSMRSKVEMSRRGFSLSDASFEISPAKRTGEKPAPIPGTGNLVADFSSKVPSIGTTIRIDSLDFRDFMAEKSNWAAIAQKAADWSLAAIDLMPEQGQADLTLEIGHGAYNERTIDDAHFGLGLNGHVGTVDAWAHLPGDVPIYFSGQVAGSKGNRHYTGSRGLHGDRPAETLHWLLPSALPAAGTDAPRSPFDIQATLSPDTPTTPHRVHADVELNGVVGAVDVALDLGPQIGVDAHASIPALDLLSYIRLGQSLDLESLGLSGVDIRAKASIDTGQASLPMVTEHAEVAIRRIDAHLKPPAAEVFAQRTPGAARASPTHAIAQWLARLPEKVDSLVHPAPAHSLIERAFPAISANFTGLETWLDHLNFANPLKLFVEQVVVRDDTGVASYRRRDASAEKVALSILSRDAPGANTVSLDLTLGAASASFARLSSAALSLEGNLEGDRGPNTRRVSAFRLGHLVLDGDIDDMVSPMPAPGLVGPAAPARRLPLLLEASGTANRGEVFVDLKHLALGDLAHFDGLQLTATERGGGSLGVRVATTGAPPRNGASGRRACPLSPSLFTGVRLLEFDIDVTGSNVSLDPVYGLMDGAPLSTAPRKPLIGSLMARGFATTGTTVVETLDLKLGDNSTIKGTFASGSEKHGTEGTVRAEGCIDAAMQTQPRLASIGAWGQEIVLPVLAPLWHAGAAGRRDPGGAFGARVEGRVDLLEDGISSDGPLHLSLRRQGSGAASDSFDIELDRLKLQLPAGTRASALRVALSGFRFKDPSGGFDLSRPGDVPSNLLTLQQTTPGRSGCAGRPDMEADLRLGTVEHLDIAAVKRFASRISGLMHGEGPPSPCDPLHLRVSAAELHSWPDLVSAFTDSPTIREAAARAPPLHNLDFTLSIDKAHALTYTMATGFHSNQSTALSCTGRESLQSHGTLSLAQGQKRGELHGVLSCLDLGDAMAIAEAASGHPLSAKGISLRTGQLDRLSFDLVLPPGDSLLGWKRMSGAIDLEGNVALDIQGSKLEMGARIYGLQEERKRGFHMKGRAEFDAGTVKGSLAVRDPLLDSATAFYGRPDAEKWPEAVAIAARGALEQKTIGAEVTIRSPEWRPMERGNACVDAARREKLATFPSWAEKMSICIPLAKGTECAKPARRQMAAVDYPCAGAAPR
jgi:hypothetical protein